MLPGAWVDSLFARLAVRYGSAWMGMWSGVDIAAVKADWAEELAGFVNAPDAIKHALENLPDRPPNVQQFRALCINRPVAFKALPEPKAAAEVVEKAMSAMSRPADHDPKAWAWTLKAREESGGKLGMVQRAAWREALKCETHDGRAA